MILVREQGININGAWFPREVCIQVLGSYECPYDEIGLYGECLYGKTNGVQHGIDESYRDWLDHVTGRFVEFEQAEHDLAHAKQDAAKYAGQHPLVHTVKTIFGQDGPSLVKYGNVWVRRWWWKQGDILNGHTHNFDHVSLLYRGSAKVTVDGVETTYHAPIELIIPKDKEHKVEALEDNTVWMCVFAVRDEKGEVDIYGEANNPSSHT